MRAMATEDSDPAPDPYTTYGTTEYNNDTAPFPSSAALVGFLGASRLDGVCVITRT